MLKEGEIMQRLFVILSIFTILFGVAGHLYADLLGITGNYSRLVSFDPYSGTLLLEHTQLNPNEVFTGLTYDPNHNKLYALSQSENNLYSIDPNTLVVSLIGQLNIGGSQPWQDANALAYDSVTDTLYTLTVDWDWPSYTNNRSELSIINIDTAELTPIGVVAGLVGAISYNEQDGHLYGHVVYGWGSWDSPYKSYVIKIDPNDASAEVLFETPYQ